LQQIARQEKITITQAEVARVIGMLAQREGITQEVAFRQLRDNGQLDSIPVNLVESKVIDLLTKAALVTEVKA
jgi:FKBP-type peptidyl-prolyl cis-trans isomerase (trigger factor)